MHKEIRMLSSDRGMTLIEVLAVIVLISLIMGVVVTNVMGKSGAAKRKLNEVKMNNVKSALASYRLEYNKYPSSLDELINGPSGGEGSGMFAAYVDKKELNDVWDFPFVYQAENNNRSFVLKSYGADGVSGGTGENADMTIQP